MDNSLTSGASCSVVCSKYILLADVQPLTSITLINADGSGLFAFGTTLAQIALNGLDTHRDSIVVNDLSTPVIMGCDFLSKDEILLDFSKNEFHCRNSCGQPKDSTC